MIGNKKIYGIETTHKNKINDPQIDDRPRITLPNRNLTSHETHYTDRVPVTTNHTI